MTNLRAAVFPFLFGILLAVSGCERPNDLPRLQDEARSVKDTYQARFDEMVRRAQAISKRGETLRAGAVDAAEAQRVYRQALTVIEDNRRFLMQVPASIDTAMRTGDPAAVSRLIDGLRERFERALIEVNAELDAVESWIGLAEQRQTSPSAPPAAASTAPAGDPQAEDPPATVQ